METVKTVHVKTIKKWFAICKDPDGELFVIGNDMKPTLFDSAEVASDRLFPVVGVFEIEVEE